MNIRKRVYRALFLKTVLPNSSLKGPFFVTRKGCKYYSSIARGKALARALPATKRLLVGTPVGEPDKIVGSPAHNSQRRIESPNEKTTGRLFDVFLDTPTAIKSAGIVTHSSDKFLDPRNSLSVILSKVADKINVHGTVCFGRATLSRFKK